ncbi:MAG: hypothetical protein AAGC66_02475 [Leifsonia sp.]
MSETPGRRKHRRVQRPGAPGTDPAPKVEPREDATRPADGDRPTWSSNDDRLRRDVPPHW